jgi:FixJ family two-component response regulator
MVQTTGQEQALVYVVDDDVAVCSGITTLLESMGMKVKAFNSANDFLQAKRPDTPSCLLLDVRLPGMSGLDFQLKLTNLGIHVPIVFMTGHADVPMGVKAMKAGAIEFLCKPFRDQDLLDAVTTAVEHDRVQRKADQSLLKLQACFDLLTPREREIMAHVVSGFMNKQIAAKLGISDITVKVHRASVIRKMGAKSLAELVRMADALKVQIPRDNPPYSKV